MGSVRARRGVFASAALAVTVLVAGPAGAAPPDPTWGAGGAAALPPTVATGAHEVMDMTSGADGSLWILGRHDTTATPALADVRPFIGHLNPDGGWDPAFGADGVADLPGITAGFADLHLDAGPSGSIQVSFPTTFFDPSCTSSGFCLPRRPTYRVMRLDARGELDSTFSGDGTFDLDDPAASVTKPPAPSTATVTPDGSTLLVTVGEPSIRRVTACCASAFATAPTGIVDIATIGDAVVTLGTDGSVTRFGLDGILRGTTPIPAIGADARLHDGGSGRITVAWTGPPPAPGAPAPLVLARLTPSGVPDGSFGEADGVARPVWPGFVPSTRLTVDDGGATYVSGRVGSSDALARLIPTGSPDLTFGVGGTTLLAGDGPGVAVPGGRLPTLTHAVIATPSGVRAAIVPPPGAPQPVVPTVILGVGPAGAIDGTFGEGGLVSPQARLTPAAQVVRAVVPLPDGGAVLAVAVAHGRTVLERVSGNDALVPGFGTDGRTESVAGIPVDLVRRRDGGLLLAVGGSRVTPVIGFRPDGSIDPTVAIPAIPGAAWTRVALTPDGGMVTATVNGFGSSGPVTLARRARDGAVTHQATSGASSTTGVYGELPLVGLAVDSLGRTVLGTLDQPGFIPRLHRFDPALQPDPSMGGVDGVEPDPARRWTAITDLRVGPADEVVVVGATSTTSGVAIRAARFGADGARDPAYGADLADVTGAAVAVAVDGRGRAVVAGRPGFGAVDPFLGAVDEGGAVALRLDADGALDATFADGGVQRWDPATARAWEAVAVAGDGRVFLGGRRQATSGVTVRLRCVSPSAAAAVYADALDRFATPAELAYWDGVAAARGSVLPMQRAILGSPEATVREARRLALSVFDDPPAGLVDQGAGALRSGVSPLDLLVEDLSGPEAETTLPTSEAWLDQTYRAILGRPPDAGGRSYWLGRLADGTARRSVARFISRSPAARDRRVDDLYRRYLDRTADAAGRAFWADRLARGASERSVTLGLLASAEYRASPLPGRC